MHVSAYILHVHPRVTCVLNCITNNTNFCLQTMLDFIAFVAKDPVVGRACFILECASGLAQDVIITIGQAFELRFKEYIQKRPPPPRYVHSRKLYDPFPFTKYPNKL